MLRMFLIIVGSCFALGVLILIASGITIVKSDCAVIVEKAGIFQEVLVHGIYYRTPFLYRLVATYNLNEQKTANRCGDYSLEFSFKIEDPRQYHYLGHCFLDELHELLSAEAELSPAKIKTLILTTAEKNSVSIQALDIYLTRSISGQ